MYQSKEEDNRVYESKRLNELSKRNLRSNNWMIKLLMSRCWRVTVVHFYLWIVLNEKDFNKTLIN